MIPDKDTNFLYLADTLPVKYPKFYEEFVTILKECNIPFGLLPHTKDVWAVDYMPVQVRDDYFLQFTYKPDYLRSKKYKNILTDPELVCDEIGIKYTTTDTIVDGGNIARCGNKVIMTDKIFKENPESDEIDLVEGLRFMLEVKKLFIIPQDPYDFTGHADGMVRFVDENTVLISDYPPAYKPQFQVSFRMALHNAGLEYIKIPYAPDFDSKYSAKGLYLNYLQMKDIIIVPTFGIEEDKAAVSQLGKVFKRHTIKTIDGNDLAANGGILNCISWNIKKSG